MDFRGDIANCRFLCVSRLLVIQQHIQSKPRPGRSTGSWPDLAPQQYRVGVLIAAHKLVLASREHLQYRYIFTLFDFVASFATGWLVIATLFATPSFRQCEPNAKSLRIAFILGLLAYYLNWALWYQRPETMMSSLFVAACVYLLARIRLGAAIVILLFALTLMQSFIRSDVAILFNGGLSIVLLLRRDKEFVAPRSALLAASFTGALTATAILWFLMHKIFPQATYGDTPVFQFVQNLSPLQWVPALLFLTPALFGLWRAQTKNAGTAGLGEALKLASVLYLASWAIVGRLEEVRIFVPFAIALAPQTANALARRVVRS